jgi:hypothetical protein
LDVSDKVVGIAAGTVAILGALIASVTCMSPHREHSGVQISQGVSPTPVRNAIEVKKDAVESLRPLMTLEKFEEQLGKPTIQNTLPSGVLESVFVDELFYVQAFSDTGSVIFFTVTTRSQAFEPTLGVESYLEFAPNRIVLGAQTFYGAVAHPRGVHVALGAHDAFYYEVYYLGNPGNYLTYVLGINEAGLYGIEDRSTLLFTPTMLDLDAAIAQRDFIPNVKDAYLASEATPSLPPDLDQRFDAFRRSARINTWGVGAPFVDFSKLQGAWMGPSYNQVRVIN